MTELLLHRVRRQLETLKLTTAKERLDELGSSALADASPLCYLQAVPAKVLLDGKLAQRSRAAWRGRGTQRNGNGQAALQAQLLHLPKVTTITVNERLTVYALLKDGTFSYGGCLRFPEPADWTASGGIIHRVHGGGHFGKKAVFSVGAGIRRTQFGRVKADPPRQPATA